VDAADAALKHGAGLVGQRLQRGKVLRIYETSRGIHRRNESEKQRATRIMKREETDSDG
jgi:hypothetical protein